MLVKGGAVARRGRKRRVDVEEEYWRLIGEGMGTVEACRIVGIGRKTGYRWRAERSGRAPQWQPERMQSSRYLSLLERQRIATLTARGLSIRQVAARIGRAPSTVSRELRRNVLRHDRGGYDGDLAHARARERRCRPRVAARLLRDAQLRALVQDKLEEDWSPEQITGWLRAEHPDRPGWHLCHETIYRALYAGDSGLSRTLTARLRTRRPMRYPRRRADRRTTRFTDPGKLIDERPLIVETRQRTGDWEGDLIVGTASRSAIGTLVERRTRYVKLVHLPDGHSAPLTAKAITEVMSAIPTHARSTLTWDQGTEMAAHATIAPMFTDGVFFAHAGKPWQRGTNENTNGLLRQYFPKGTDLRAFSETDLRHVEERLNNRPRKAFGWRTPAQLFAAEIGST